MLTSVQKEILQTLINLYQNSDSKSIKGESIAEVMNRNPGDKKLEDASVAKIEFTSITHPGECEAAIKVLGNIKNLNIGDTVRVGPTPVNNLGLIGTIVGRDDMDNILLLDISTIRSIPKNSVYEIASLDLIYLEPGDSIKYAANLLSSKHIDGAPVITEGVAIGMISLTDIVKALINKDTRIATAVYKMYKFGISRLIVVDDEHTPIGVVTRTDLIETITNLKNFPVLGESDLEDDI